MKQRIMVAYEVPSGSELLEDHKGSDEVGQEPEAGDGWENGGWLEAGENRGGRRGRVEDTRGGRREGL